MTESPFEIRIICDMKANPRHGGRDRHITALAHYDADELDRAHPWRLSPREIRKARRGAPLIRVIEEGQDGGKRSPVNYRNVPLPPFGDVTSKRVEIQCDRCDIKVSGLMDRLTAYLDAKRENGEHVVLLRDLHAVMERAKEKHRATLRNQGRRVLGDVLM